MKRSFLIPVLAILLIGLMPSLVYTSIPPVPMTVYGYVFIQTPGGNITAPQGLYVHAKMDTTEVSNATTEADGYYVIAISGPSEGTLIDLWVQDINITRITLQYYGILALDLTVIDTESPIITVISPTPGATVTAPVWINATLYDKLAINTTTITLTLNTTTTTPTYDPATGLLYYNTGTLTPGLYIINITVKDLAENQATETWNFTVKELVPPTVDIISPTMTSPIYTQANKNITVNYTYTETDPVNATIKVYNSTHVIGETTVTGLTGGINVNRSDIVNIQAGAVDGAYNVSVTICNIDNFIGTDEEANAVIVDNTPPAVNITYPTQGANVTISQTIWINGTVTELNKGAAEPVIDDVRFSLTYWNPATGEFAFSNNTLIFPGLLYFAVNFTDLAGNTGLDDVLFNLILPPPQLQLKGVTGWYWVNDTTITSVVVGDVDGDGSNETVTGGYYYDGTRTVAQLAVWNGSTLALERVTVWYWVGNTTITSVAIGDVDGDGQKEIVTVGYYHDGTRKIAQLAVWDGATLSLEGVTVWYWVGDTCINSVAVGDIDADGAAEIVTAGYYNDGVRDVAQLVVWDGQTLSLEGVTVRYWVGDTTINSVAIGDVDGDGFSEIVTGGYYNDGTRDVAQLAVWNGSTPVLEGVTVWYWVGDTRINSVAIGDVDGDASVEIVTGGYYEDGFKIAQLATWDGATLSLEDVTVWNWVGDTTINSVAVGDVDGDGQIEIVTGGSYHDGTYDNAQLAVWKGSDLTLETVTGWQWVGDTRINDVAVGDVVSDGDIEIVTGGSYHDGTRTVAQLTEWVVTSG